MILKRPGGLTPLYMTMARLWVCVGAGDAGVTAPSLCGPPFSKVKHTPRVSESLQHTRRRGGLGTEETNCDWVRGTGGNENVTDGKSCV